MEAVLIEKSMNLVLVATLESHSDYHVAFVLINVVVMDVYLRHNGATHKGVSKVTGRL